MSLGLSHHHRFSADIVWHHVTLLTEQQETEKLIYFRGPVFSLSLAFERHYKSIVVAVIYFDCTVKLFFSSVASCRFARLTFIITSQTDGRL